MQKLIEGLQNELTIYEALLIKTVEEKDAFLKKDNDLFIAALEERLGLMNQINALEGELKPLRESWIESKDSFSEDFNNEVISLAQKIKGKMDNILDLEKCVIDEKMKGKQEVNAVVKSKAINKYKNI